MTIDPAARRLRKKRSRFRAAPRRVIIPYVNTTTDPKEIAEQVRRAPLVTIPEEMR